MNKVVAKRVGLVVLSVAAVGVAVYRLSQPWGGLGTIDPNMNVHFVLLGTETSDTPLGVTMTLSKYHAHKRNRQPIIIDGSDSVSRAGLCPAGHYYPLGGHLDQPAVCTVASCDIPVRDYDLDGNPKKRPAQDPGP